MTANKLELFKSRLQSQFPNDYETILSAIDAPVPLTFRICADVKNIDEVLTSLSTVGFEIAAGPIPASYIVKRSPDNLRLSDTQPYIDGKIYIQKLSSMLPATILAPVEGDSVLDMCAAPGSKTIQLVELTGNNANIVAVETNRNRYFRLQENLQKYNGGNVLVLNEDASLLPFKYPQYINYFTKILIDAPCSNEGQIVLSDPASISHWNPKLSKKISKLQKRLISTGAALLSSGCTLLYSTCTFSLEENEKVIEWVARKLPNLELLDQKRIFPDGKFTAFYYALFKKVA